MISVLTGFYGGSFTRKAAAVIGTFSDDSLLKRMWEAKRSSRQRRVERITGEKERGMKGS